MIADSVWRTLKGRIARLFSEETRKKAESDGSYRVSLCFAMRFSTKVSESLQQATPLKRGELRREIICIMIRCATHHQSNRWLSCMDEALRQTIVCSSF